ncbi:methyltransferase [Streptomyces indicus]|uniref:Release factor glutamine methyltransferase n=1 Tax=Streptomyces indicus TaxID=417292 RepID=A0A1G9HHX4_9ACTN|nr:methyltransferase [Streptomyces indicus]SDL12462.1 release factor glutamine methyltransferase [Streptomyces indicus]
MTLPGAALPDAYDPLVVRLRTAGCVFAEEEARLLRDAAPSPAALEDMTLRRIAGEPLEQVVGWAEFAGLRILLDPGVFVPRRRTEFLVTVALDLLTADALPGGPPSTGAPNSPPPDSPSPTAQVIVDLCCGSGAVGAALAAALPDADLHAADLDPAAVSCARRNLPPSRVHEGDLFAALPRHLRGRISLLAANVPYVRTSDIPFLPSEAREHEPLTALDGGEDGLTVARRVAAEAAAWLAPGGHVLIEATESQVPSALRLFEGAGLSAKVVTDEDWEAQVVVGTFGPSAV